MKTVFLKYINRFLIIDSTNSKTLSYQCYLLSSLNLPHGLPQTFFRKSIDNWWSKCYSLTMRNGYFLLLKNTMKVSYLNVKFSSFFRIISQPLFHNPSLSNSKLKLSPSILPRQFLGKKFFLGTYLEKPKAGELLVEQL